MSTPNAVEPAIGAVTLLLARAYYHSAQLGRAERTLRDLLNDDPSDGYAHLLLGRTLQRRSRHAGAAPHLRLAAALVAPPSSTSSAGSRRCPGRTSGGAPGRAGGTSVNP